MSRIIFVSVAILVLIFMNTYAYQRFIARLELLNIYKRLLKWLMILMTLCEIGYTLMLQSDTLNLTLYTLFSSFVGVSFMLFCVALIYDIFHTPLHKIPFDASRRLMLKMLLDVVMLGLAFSYILRGFINGKKAPVLNEVEIFIEGLSKEFVMVQISDVHVGKTLGKDFLAGVVDEINKNDADLVVITGDLADVKASQAGGMLESLSQINARFGTYFVPGNHEYFYGVKDMMEYLEYLGVNVLFNRSMLIDDSFYLAGVGDLAGRRFKMFEPDLKKALAQTKDSLPTILLSHQPKIAKELKNERVDLVVSGHTHGGQIFPFGLLVLLDQPYLSGLYQHSPKTQIFVSNGVGYWGPPVRVLAQSEIVKIRLKPKP
ncbi:MAG: metallophosphoesterase [Sulfurospirillaceae bacterium]|nr:metallophosphoesterase [Sulfurospirillaceae bacterium]